MRMHRKNKFLVYLIVFLIMIIIFSSGCIQNGDSIHSSINEIKNAGKIIVGTSAPYKPMEYFDENGTLIGFDIDIARKIAEHLDVTLEFKNMNFDELLDAVKNGEIDIAIAAITITAERSKEVLFSKPYLNAGQVIIVNETNKNISQPEDLLYKIVGVQNDTTSENEALKYTGNSSLVKTYMNYTSALNDLILGKLDAIIIDRPAGLSLINNISGIIMIDLPFTNELYGIAMQKDKNGLKQEVDRCLTVDFLKNLEDKWFK